MCDNVRTLTNTSKQKMCLTKQQAAVLEGLLGNAGLLDDADEIIADMLDNNSEEETREYCTIINGFVSIINQYRTDDNEEKITLDCLDELQQIIDNS